jgi:hypothetical protein
MFGPAPATPTSIAAATIAALKDVIVMLAPPENRVDSHT